MIYEAASDGRFMFASELAGCAAFHLPAFSRATFLPLSDDRSRSAPRPHQRHHRPSLDIHPQCPFICHSIPILPSALHSQ